MTGSAAVSETWLREALARVSSELASFARTFAAFLVRPARSARAWQDGTAEFMNPLAFGATAAGVYWGIANVLGLIWPVPGNESADTLASEIAAAVSPYLHYGLLGIAMHLVLRLLGSGRTAIGSLGIAFFAGGSIGTLGALVTSGVARWFAHERGTTSLQLQSSDLMPLLIFAAAILFYALMCVMLARALKALHYTATWKVITAATFAVLITAFLFGNLIPDGDYGWHPYIRVQPDAAGLGLSFGFEG